MTKSEPYQFLTSFVGYSNGLIINKTERKSEALRKGEEYWITINETSHKEDDTIYLETNLWQYTIKTKNQIWFS